jgi:hypothetical protein
VLHPTAGLCCELQIDSYVRASGLPGASAFTSTGHIVATWNEARYLEHAAAGCSERMTFQVGKARLAWHSCLLRCFLGHEPLTYHCTADERGPCHA